MVLLGGWFSSATRRKKRSASCGVRGRVESCAGIGGSDFRGPVERAVEVTGGGRGCEGSDMMMDCDA